jgi:hypothetical protein
MPKEFFCPYIRAFIDRNGNLFPCCFKNADPRFIIGNISEQNLLEKMENFFVICQCEFMKFRKRTASDTLNSIHIQTSLKCHGGCAVCYVGAPQKKESIEVDYDNLFRFFQRLRPKAIYFEGGEVPIQPRALDFVAKIREELQPQYIHLLTNGCYEERMAERLVQLFNRMTISFMGVTKNVYFMETKMDVIKTKSFAEAVHASGCTLGFRYICTPLTTPEAHIFLEYFSKFSNSHVIYADCDLSLYIKSPEHPPYWHQVIIRAQQKFRQVLLENRDAIVANSLIVRFEPRTASLLNITQKLVDTFHLRNVLFY